MSTRARSSPIRSRGVAAVSVRDPRRPLPRHRPVRRATRRNSRGVRSTDPTRARARRRRASSHDRASAARRRSSRARGNGSAARRVRSGRPTRVVGTVVEADTADGRPRASATSSRPGRRGMRAAAPRAPMLERAADVDRARPPTSFIALARARSRQDARPTRWPKCARRSTSAATTRAGARHFDAPLALPGPTGESNKLRCTGAACSRASARGTFRSRSSPARCAAALAAGNAVVAKPAEQTPLIAALAVALLHEAGVPPRRAAVAAGRRARRSARRWSRDPRIAGVAFTGSTETARADQPHARRARRPDRAADRRDRRTERDDRRPFGAARAGGDAMLLPRRSTARASAARRCACCACRRMSAPRVLDDARRRDGRAASRRSGATAPPTSAR